MAWQVQEAKQKFSALVQKAIDEGPQIVTKHGEEIAVVVSKAEYDKLNGKKRDFKEFLMSGPDWSELETERRKDVWDERRLGS